MSRDKELDDLMEGLKTPFIEEPDTRKVGDGAECFMDCMRMCSPTCMAYVTDEVDEDENFIQGADKCMVLSSMNATNANLITLTALTRRQLRETQDRQRMEHIEPPSPYGKKPT